MLNIVNNGVVSLWLNPVNYQYNNITITFVTLMLSIIIIHAVKIHKL